MTQQRNFWTRWRVRTGYPVAVIYWLLSAPTARSIATGAIVVALGLVIRGSASGHLRKYEELATTGPYAWTRNPLYLGSGFLAAGFAIAGYSWWAGFFVIAYFAIFYCAVMRNEEEDLRRRYGASFDQYAARVPLFFPRIEPRDEPSAARDERPFSWPQYRRNREYKALVGSIAGLGIVWLRIWIRTKWGY